MLGRSVFSVAKNKMRQRPGGRFDVRAASVKGDCITAALIDMDVRITGTLIDLNRKGMFASPQEGWG
jgi:hypothetical protein